MDESTITGLIQEIRAGRDEDDGLELKRKFWNLKEIKGQGEFLKDIAGMANGKGDLRLILVGVDGKGQLYDTDLPEDEANIQQRLEKITPVPHVQFQKMEVEGTRIVVVSVRPPYDSPYVTSLESRNIVFVRKGSKIGTASRYQLDQFYKSQAPSPTLSVHWIDKNEEEQDTFILLPPKYPDFQAEVERLLAGRPSDEDLAFLEQNKREISQEIMRTSGAKFFDMAEGTNPAEIIAYPSQITQQIDQFRECVNQSPDDLRIRYNLEPYELHLKTLNSGNKPSQNMTIYVENTDKIRFLSFEEGEKLEIVPPTTAMLLRSRKIIQFAKGVEPIPRAAIHHPYIWSGRDFPTPIGNIFSTKKIQSKVEGGCIRIDNSGSLSHGFSFYESMFCYIWSELKKGESVQVPYVCHADNLPTPDKGFITIKCAESEE